MGVRRLDAAEGIARTGTPVGEGGPFGGFSGLRHLGDDPIFVVVHALVILATVAQYAIFPLLPRMEATWGVSSLVLAVLVALPTAIMIAGAMPTGRLCDRWGARQVTFTGTALLALSCGLQATPWIVSFAVGRVVFGLASTAIWTGAPAWLHRSRPGSSSRVGSVVTSAAAGTIAGPALSGLVADRLGLGWPYLMTGAAAGLLALVNLVDRGGQTQRQRSRHQMLVPPRASDLLRSRDAVAAMLAMVAVGAASGAMQLLVPLQLGRTGHTATSIGFALCASGVVYVVVSTLTSRTPEKRVTANKVVVECLLMGLMIIPAAGAIDSAALVLVCLLAFTLPRAVLNTLGYRLTSRSDLAIAGHIGFVIGALNLVWAAAASAGPVGAGWLEDRLGARAAFLGTGTTSLTVGLALLLLLRHPWRWGWPTPTTSRATPQSRPPTSLETAGAQARAANRVPRAKVVE